MVTFLARLFLRNGLRCRSPGGWIRLSVAAQCLAVMANRTAIGAAGCHPPPTGVTLADVFVMSILACPHVRALHLSIPPPFSPRPGAVRNGRVVADSPLRATPWQTLSANVPPW
ncbi:hypothetical protein BO71DRAFT_122117 [Aspergillus ellipticus CBS 707.79]|uniref:Uncharacterized protein n=1 Tax=Aspergillus ellipticus CBS 707.79 TaxID=1448320 RepID=A0A319DLK5_9EURO|nr:hypothetical protein BO71DRAFT_122117 [Aspergillus ellipticus CBS 707.79]